MTDDELAQLQKWIEEFVATSVTAGADEADAIVTETVDRWSTDKVRRQWVRAVAWRAVTAAMAGHLAAQDDLPDETDNDRLAAAFRELDRLGILARERLGISLSDGWALIRDAVNGMVGVQPARGCVFYHEQDRHRAAQGGHLWLAFGTLGDQPGAEIGAQIAEALRKHGLTVEWDGDPDVRIRVAMRWQARRKGRLAVAAPPPGADFWPPADGPLVGWSGRADRKEATTGWLRARHAAGEIVCANADGFLEPAAPAGGFFPGYLTTTAMMIERSIDTRQLASLVASGNVGHVDWYQESERLCGVPNRLTHGLSHLFTALPSEDRADFVVEAVNAIPVGADLSPVCDRWILDLLVDPDHGVIRHTSENAPRAATETVAAALRRRLAGDDPNESEWHTVRKESYEVGAYAAFFAAQESPGDVAKAAVGIASIAAGPTMPSDAATDAARAARRWQARRLIHHIATA